MILARYQLLGFIPLIALMMRVASAPTASLSYLVVAGYALLGRIQAIQALALSWLFSMLNAGLAPGDGAGSVGRYAILMAAAVSVLRVGFSSRRHRQLSLMMLATILLGVFFVAHSLFFSSMVEISVLKAVSWAVAMSTLIAGWGSLAPEEHALLGRQLFGGLVGLMLLSLPLLVLPQGYRVNGTGFQGILNEPQTFGPAMALLGARAASQMFSQKRPPWMTVGLVATCLVLVVLSEARTGGVGLVIGVGLAILFGPSLSGRRGHTLLPGLRSRRLYIVGGLAFAVTLIAWPILNERLNSYFVKRGEAANLSEAYEISRGALMRDMWENIEDKPLQGIGFGIASIPELMVVDRDPLFGLPTGASIEKGVLPLAVLEEVGFFGFILVVAWVWMILRRSARGGVEPLAVCITALMVNMGEATLFSPGGMGLLSLVLLGWAHTSGHAMGIRK